MAGEWPVRWAGSNFKAPRVNAKVTRTLKRKVRDNTENQNKAEVRRRDNKACRGGCRFPLCGCRKFNLAKHVCHLEHKGMGGNPLEDRSAPEKMIQACIARHREHVFSLDKGTVQCRPRTRAGTDGPVEWWLDVETLRDYNLSPFTSKAEWWLVARESAPGVLEPLSAAQLEVLEALAGMQL